MILSLFIVEFLRAVSECPETKNHLQTKDKESILKQALYYEHNMHNDDQFREVPILVEDTVMGASFDSLLNTITAPKHIQPYNYVSFRILYRLANLIQNRKRIFKEVNNQELVNPEQNKNYDEDLSEKLGFYKLEQTYREILKFKINYEQNVWRDESEIDQKDVDRVFECDKDHQMKLKKFITQKNESGENGFEVLLKYMTDLTDK